MSDMTKVFFVLAVLGILVALWATYYTRNDTNKPKKGRQ